MSGAPAVGRSSISGIVLAAGTSSRLGRPKQLLQVGGRPVLLHVVEAALASPLDEVVVVLGHRAREIAAAVPPRERARIAMNPDFAAGQSTSLRVGLRAADVDAGGAVVLLADQPGIRPEAIAAVVEAWRAGVGPVVQASYGGRVGHPVLVDRSLWPGLEATVGDWGARSILGAHPEWRSVAEVGGDPPDDIDTEDDYERVRAALEAG